MLENSEKSRPLVFISYSHSDVAEASRLRNDILAAGIEVWWDQDLLGGQDWKYEIREAIKRCDAVILCLSRKCITRRKSGIYPEALDAIAIYREYKPGEIFLIPIRFSECHIPSIEIDGTRTLDRLQHIDLFPHGKWSENLKKIIASIGATFPTHLTNPIHNTPMVVDDVPVVEIEITINSDFESYTEADQDQLLRAIREFLKMKGNLKIKTKRPGSVKITIDLSPQQAEELLRAIKAGYFEQYNIVYAEIKEISEKTLTYSDIYNKYANESKEILSIFKDDKIAHNVVELILSDDIYSPRVIAVILGVGENEIYNTNKRIRRKLRKFFLSRSRQD